MKTVLVTGGAGYIGSHTSKALARKGYTPVCFDNLSTGHAEAVKWGPLVQGDLKDKELILSTLKKYTPIAVMHFAASCYVEESMREPHRYYENNVVTTLNLLQAMRETSVKHLVFSSSCATYGIPTEIPITENAVQKPINTYGQTKLMCEQMIQDSIKTYGFSAVILRYFNAAGADLEGEIGESHFPETHLIPLVLRSLLQSQPFFVFGDDYPTEDGTAVRDYIHVMDLAQAHIDALNLLLRTQTSHAFNIGTGNGYSIKDILSVAQTLIGKEPCIHVNPKRAGDPARLVANPALASSLLGWKPRYSDLNTLLQTALNWQKQLLAV